MGDKDKDTSIQEYIEVIRPYLSDTINTIFHSDNIIIQHKTQGESKIHLTMGINFISLNDNSHETCIHKVRI